MADSDLVAAIQNALARGQNIESAMQSLLNAGYSREEVQEAAREAQLSMQQKQAQIQSASMIPQAAKKPILKNKKIILLLVLLSIIALGIIAYLITKSV